jgi:hypothetical protein
LRWWWRKNDLFTERCSVYARAAIDVGNPVEICTYG